VTIGGTAATSVVTTATTITAKTPAGTAGAKDVVVTTVGGSATRGGGFTYQGSPSSMRGNAVGGGSSPADGGITLPQIEQPTCPVTMERALALIVQSGVTESVCDGTACDAMPPSTDAQSLAGPQGPDLDGNGMPDLCQLRCGDLDLNGRIDEGDLAILMTLIGEEPVLGVGDLDGDGAIGSEDLAELAARAHALR
jgi:hypothetical protein